MAHLSEASQRLIISRHLIQNSEELHIATHNLNEVCVFILPPKNSQTGKSHEIAELMGKVSSNLGENAVFITVGDSEDLAYVHDKVSSILNYQLWISVKRKTPLLSPNNTTLPKAHFGLLIHTSYHGSLKHAITRVEYSYCPACGKTTKDYGGKKHTFNPYGTLMSDVWRDISCNYEGDFEDVLVRLADLFGIEPYREVCVFDCRQLTMSDEQASLSLLALTDVKFTNNALSKIDPSIQIDREQINQLILGDCLEELRKLPDNSIDFAFADPPYNLKKQYNDYYDDLDVVNYFEWCDQWIAELVRVLKPGRTLAILNIPLWAIRHFLFLDDKLHFQNWISWDSLSFPVRHIMPANYVILCFSKGYSRPLPGLSKPNEDLSNFENYYVNSGILSPQAENFCSRKNCVSQRRKEAINDRALLTDLWWDVHRLKHNTRRVDHPCQLPPLLLYRLITLFSEPQELVLDCFNGAGTTTVTADQLGRRYIGIEASEKYVEIARERHADIRANIDPFRKQERVFTEKNSRTKRLPKRKYEISKKELQLEVKRIASVLGRYPSRVDVVRHGRHSIEYYDEYFSSWGEACAAVRHAGMSEWKNGSKESKIAETTLKWGDQDAKR